MLEFELCIKVVALIKINTVRLWESVDSAHNSQISSTFQEADCLLKLVKINKQVFAITFEQKLEPYCSAEHQLGGGGIIILSVGLGEVTEKTLQKDDVMTR